MRFTATPRIAITATAALALGGLVVTSTTVAATDEARNASRLVVIASDSSPGLCMHVPATTPGTVVVARNCAMAAPDDGASAFEWIGGQLRPAPRLPEPSPGPDVCVTGLDGPLSYLTLQTCTGAPSQVWTHIASTLQLRNGLARCVDPYFHIEDNHRLTSWKCTAHDLQRWTVTDVETPHGP